MNMACFNIVSKFALAQTELRFLENGRDNFRVLPKNAVVIRYKDYYCVANQKETRRYLDRESALSAIVELCF